MQGVETDYLVIGAGIIGLTIARELALRHPHRKILVIENEKDVGLHSSGRNSGVLHAGFYYSADSLKARFTKEGNARMKRFCHDQGLPVNECHKVVVATRPEEIPLLYELEKRGQANNVDIRLIDEKELADIEPNACTTGYALYSPSTATVDPMAILQCLKNDLLLKGIQISFNEGYKKRIETDTILTTKGRFISAGMIFNTAGLYADRIARDFGFSDKYVIIPFKGLYLKYSGPEPPVKINVYPVPDLRNPFLGVHFTVTVSGEVKIGPTAIPALWRENYKGFRHFDPEEFLQILFYESRLFANNAFGFRTLAFSEMKKYRKKHFIHLASKLVKHLPDRAFNQWSKPGIRAQLLNTETLELVQDFVVEGDKHSVHVLNAVSPAFTCSFAISEWIINYFTI